MSVFLILSNISTTQIAKITFISYHFRAQVISCHQTFTNWRTDRRGVLLRPANRNRTMPAYRTHRSASGWSLPSGLDSTAAVKYPPAPVQHLRKTDGDSSAPRTCEARSVTAVVTLQRTTQHCPVSCIDVFKGFISSRKVRYSGSIKRSRLLIALDVARCYNIRCILHSLSITNLAGYSPTKQFRG